MEDFAACKRASQFVAARDVLKALLILRPGDPYVVQQLALATYKAKDPDVPRSLAAAREILAALAPHQTNDPETLGLWGAIHKRLWEVAGNRADLDESIFAYERGFSLRGDYYNGINFAFMLNVRAVLSSRADAIADWITAERIRRRVLEVCRAALNATPEENADDRFWIQATIAEAWLGLGEMQEYAAALARANRAAGAVWMCDSMNEQLAGLARLLENSPLRELEAAKGPIQR